MIHFLACVELEDPVKNNVTPMETNESSPSQKVSHDQVVAIIYRTLYSCYLQTILGKVSYNIADVDILEVVFGLVVAENHYSF